VDRVTRNMYSANPRVDRHHLISISSNHTMKVWTLSSSTFVRSRFFWYLIDPHCHGVLYPLTRFVLFSNQQCDFSCIPFGYCERCGGVMMVGSLPSGSIISSQWLPSGPYVSFLNGCVQVSLQFYSTTICGQVDHMYIDTALNNACHIMM
jgi:hypothetical protein